MPVSPNGWPIAPPTSSRLVPGTSVHLTVADGPIGDVLIYVAAQFNARVEKLEPSIDDWGYSYRPNTNNTAVWSEHAAGAAIDLNALKHPNGAKSTFNAAQFREIDKILSEVNNVVIQLRGYDEMHFEVKRTSLANVQAAANKVRGSVAPTRPTSASNAPTIKRGADGPAVEFLQDALNVVPNTDPGYGTFGPATEAAVRAFQRSHGLAEDGIVGPNTWARIFADRVGSGNSGSGSSSTTRPTLRRGSSGKEVSDLQAFLNRVFPSYSSLAVDGSFGERTEAVVREFQRRSLIVDDGIVGPATWRALGFRD